MKQKIGLLALVFLICAFCVAAANPAAAAKTKMVDKGSFKGTDPDLGYYKFSWFTYQKGTKYVKINTFMYIGSLDSSFKMTFVMQKIGKKKLKLTTYLNGKKMDTEYDYTKLTAAQYYWRNVRPGLSPGSMM